MKISDNQRFKYVILFLPWALATVLQTSPVISYLIAWCGSFYIFFVVFAGVIKPLPADRTLANQLMRPVYLVHLIFAGYMSCSSIFYFLNLTGSYHTAYAVVNIDHSQLLLTAQCQRYYCLGHAAFVSGILVFMKYPAVTKYYVEKEKIANLLLTVALITFPLSLFFLTTPGLAQFYFQLNSLSFISGTLALAFALPLRKLPQTVICFILYSFNFYNALTSGFKEPVIVSVLVLGIFLYPSYKKAVIVFFVPLMLALFVYLPSYVNSFRGNAWGNGETSADASQLAIDGVLNNDDIDDTNWGFLVYRLSEIDMFTDYIKSTPEYVDYYRFSIIEQAAIAVIPRFFWPSKPVTEDMIMERVYVANVISRNSQVSAKPAVIVDAYLTFGAPGIFLALFIYGAAAQLIALKAEQLFGGYTLGCALIFGGLFEVFWRGMSFEFLVNSVFWSYISMMIIFKVLRFTSVLKVHVSHNSPM
ncbi:exosortase Y-associated Wzy-like protein [Mucilaginibacter sp.]|uniref:exosortase Y-associated Wzy-like protein n=1 Tax=Mucilaginibacter sp. TaxID=1882438 RepID=UPI0035BC27BE